MFTFGRRKLQQSNYSYWISLPLNWLKNNELERGDEIIVDMNELGELILRPLPSTPGMGVIHNTMLPVDVTVEPHPTPEGGV